MAIAAGVMQAVGAGMSATGAYYGAKQQKTQLGFDAEMDELNARLSEQQAQQALSAGQKASQQSMMQTAQLKSTQRAELAASGVVLGQGSAGILEASTDIMGQIDKNTIEANAIQDAWGYRSQAVQQQNEARMKRAAAKGINPRMAAEMSLLGSSSQVASSFSQAKQSGAYGGKSGSSASSAPKSEGAAK